ncbi:MAG: hypothetical protein AAGD28_28940, partial [Bacteroidota bacterium]
LAPTHFYVPFNTIIMKKLIPVLLFSFLFSCTSISEDELIVPQENSVKEFAESQTDSDPNKLAKSSKTCRCTFRTEVSPNLVGEEWDVTIRVEENGQPEIIVVDGDGVPMPSNPFIFSRHFLTKFQVIPTSMRFLYGDPDQALDEDGWIRVNISCRKAPSVTYTLPVPSYDNSGSVYTEKYTQITSNCATMEVTKE